MSGNTKILVRNAREQDVPAVVEIDTEAFSPVKSGAMPPVSYFETVKKHLGMQIAQISPEYIAWKLPKPSGPTVWKFPEPSDAQQLNDAIVNQILKIIRSKT